ncbi:hypothetical protein FRC02_001864 [Tulasnella sp. 418]|nr:hypothetical protein FRC02_001864 [Tulasnella sp. 418]
MSPSESLPALTKSPEPLQTSLPNIPLDTFWATRDIEEYLNNVEQTYLAPLPLRPRPQQTIRVKANAQPLSQQQPAANAVQAAKVCQNCIIRDRDVVDVDATGDKAWERESNVWYQELIIKDCEDEVNALMAGVDLPTYLAQQQRMAHANGEAPRPRAKGEGPLTTENLKAWLKMDDNMHYNRLQILQAYVESQNALITAEAPAMLEAIQESEPIETEMRDLVLLESVAIAEQGDALGSFSKPNNDTALPHVGGVPSSPNTKDPNAPMRLLSVRGSNPILLASHGADATQTSSAPAEENRGSGYEQKEGANPTSLVIPDSLTDMNVELDEEIGAVLIHYSPNLGSAIMGFDVENPHEDLTKQIEEAFEKLDLNAIRQAYIEQAQAIRRYKEELRKKESELQELRAQVAGYQYSTPNQQLDHYMEPFKQNALRTRTKLSIERGVSDEVMCPSPPLAEDDVEDSDGWCTVEQSPELKAPESQ